MPIGYMQRRDGCNRLRAGGRRAPRHGSPTAKQAGQVRTRTRQNSCVGWQIRCATSQGREKNMAWPSRRHCRFTPQLQGGRGQGQAGEGEGRRELCGQTAAGCGQVPGLPGQQCLCTSSTV